MLVHSSNLGLTNDRIVDYEIVITRANVHLGESFDLIPYCSKLGRLSEWLDHVLASNG